MNNLIVGKVSVGDSPEILGCSIDRPISESEAPSHAVDVEGWILTREQLAIDVEIVCQKAILGSAPVNRKRQDVGRKFPQVKNSAACGFRLAASLLGLPKNFRLILRAVFENDRRLPVATIEGTRTPLPSGSPCQIQPLMLTTLARTGSTWLTHLLGQHPEILSYRPFQYETRVANYWMQILKTLGDPNSYLHSLATELGGRPWWLGDRQPPVAFPLLDPEIERWLGSEAIGHFSSCCRNLTEGFYKNVAELEGKKDPAFFVEKFSPDPFLQETVAEVYPGSRELVLVRDFRDMLCSILAYNRKRHMTGFGRQFASTDEEYVHRLRTTALRLLWSWQRRSRSAHLVRYEELLLEPEKTLRSILRYLGLSSANAIAGEMLERAFEKRAEAQAMHQTSSSWQSSIGRWERELDSRLKAACGPAFDDVLEEFGYENAREPAL